MVNTSEYNLIWDLDEADNFRSYIFGEPIFDMKCNKCLSFVGAATTPDKITSVFCPHCVNKIKREQEQ